MTSFQQKSVIRAPPQAFGLAVFIAFRGFLASIFSPLAGSDEAAPIWRASVELKRSTAKFEWTRGDWMESLPLERVITDWPCEPFDDAWSVWVGDSHNLIAGADEAAGWRQLAMIFGDSGAPDLCAITALQANSLSQQAGDTAKAQWAWNHVVMALRDIGIVIDKETGQERAGAWYADYLQLLQGDLGRGADLCRRAALIRARLVSPPEPVTIDGIFALARPATSQQD
jgi:hypothetical protein